MSEDLKRAIEHLLSITTTHFDSGDVSEAVSNLRDAWLDDDSHGWDELDAKIAWRCGIKEGRQAERADVLAYLRKVAYLRGTVAVEIERGDHIGAAKREEDSRD